MPKFVDPYLDQDTGVLRNLVGAKTQKELDQIEADYVFTVDALRGFSEVKPTRDLRELCAIHKALFGDIYDWAGKTRTVDIRKNAKGSEFFLIHSKILMASDYVFGELRSENFLHNLEKEQFIERLAYFYDQLNFIHPFREGNGRTQRIFWSRVAESAGYTIDWDRVRGKENDIASKLAAEKMDLSLLVKMFRKIVTKNA